MRSNWSRLYSCSSFHTHIPRASIWEQKRRTVTSFLWWKEEEIRDWRTWEKIFKFLLLKKGDTKKKTEGPRLIFFPSSSSPCKRNFGNSRYGKKLIEWRSFRHWHALNPINLPWKSNFRIFAFIEVHTSTKDTICTIKRFWIKWINMHRSMWPFVSHFS